MLTKREFKKRYNAATPLARQEIKKHYETLYKEAVFENTFDEAEKYLLWIREIEEGY